MANLKLSNDGGFMGSGDKKSQIMMVVVLLILIGGSLYFSLRNLWGGKNSRAAEQHYKCMSEDCGKEFPLKQEDMMPPEGAGGPEGAMPPMGPGMMPGMFGMAIKCKECGAENSAVPMTPCPSCKKHFVPEWTMRQYQAQLEGKQPDPAMMMGMGPGEKNICPHCNTDINEWHRSQRKK